MALPLEQYAIVGDTHTAAVIGSVTVKAEPPDPDSAMEMVPPWAVTSS